MPNIPTTAKASARQENTLDQLFPNWRDEQWKCSKQEPGFTPVPRTLSLIAGLTKHLREKKKDDPSIVYFDLWFRAFNGLVEIRDERELAYSCGFTTNRGVRTWRERVACLEKQGFIKSATRCGSISHIFLRNPDMVVSQLSAKRKLPKDWENEYEMRMKEIKAKRWEKPKAK